MTIWTVCFRSPQNSNQKTRTKMAGTTKVDSQLLEPCIFTSSCLERHSVPSKRNLHCRVCCCRSTTWHWLCMGYGGWSVPICCSPVVPVRCMLREFIEKFWTSNPCTSNDLCSCPTIPDLIQEHQNCVLNRIGISAVTSFKAWGMLLLQKLAHCFKVDSSMTKWSIVWFFFWLKFLFDSKPPYSGKNLQMNLRQISYIPNLQFPDGNWAVLKTPLAWWHGGMVSPYLFKTTGPNQNNQSLSGICMFPCIVISADFFRALNVMNHKTIDLANI